MKTVHFLKPLVTYIFFLSLLSLSCLSQTRYLIPYRDGILWGYADTNQKIAVSPKYDMAFPFWAGYALVKKAKAYGVLNGKGKVVIPALYDTLMDCCYRYTIAKKENNHGLIELATGSILLPVKYERIDRFYGDFCIVTDKKLFSGVVNLKTRKWLLPIGYTIEPDLFPWYKATKGNTTLYFKGQKEKLVFDKGPLQLKEIQSVVNDAVPPTEKLEVTNGQASIHVRPAYDSVIIPREMGWLEIVRKNGRWGVYSWNTYNEIIPLVYDKVEAVFNRDFKEFFIVTKEAKTGVVDKENKIVVPFRYDEIRQTDSSVYNNFYIVKLNGLTGVTKGNEEVLPCSYDYLWTMNSNGTAYVLHKNNKRGVYIYRRHKGLDDVFIEPKYDRVIAGFSALQPYYFDPNIPYRTDYNLRNIIIEVYKDNKKGYVDQNGREFFEN